MYYQINVSLQVGDTPPQHLFATAERSLRDKQAFLRCLKIFKKKFLASQGFVLICTHWTNEGRAVTDEGDILCQ